MSIDSVSLRQPQINPPKVFTFEIMLHCIVRQRHICSANVAPIGHNPMQYAFKH